MPALVAAALAAGLAFPVTPTMSTVPQGPAQLVAKGVAVQLSITVSCNLTAVANLYGDIDQTVGGVTASASFFTDVQCSPTPQTVVVTATTYTDRALRKGPAAVSVQGYVCGEVDCAFSPDGYAEITLRK